MRAGVSDLRLRAWEAASRVVDPEIPVLTIADLGVLREVRVDGGHVEVLITPTYSGCPAMQAIALDVQAALAGAGIRDASVRTVLAPAWTTDWMSEDGKRKLREYGIAPPIRCDAARLPALRFRGYRDAVRVRLHLVQGALALPRMPRAVRPFPMSLIPPRFHSLRVKEKRQETGDAVSLVFEVPDGLGPLYRFAPGQYLTLARDDRGRGHPPLLFDLRRSRRAASRRGEARRGRAVFRLGRCIAERGAMRSR